MYLFQYIITNKATVFFPQSKTILPLFEVARVLMLALHLWFLSKLFLPHHLKCDVRSRNLGTLNSHMLSSSSILPQLLRGNIAPHAIDKVFRTTQEGL